jgi:hypothetical protein
MDSDKANLGTPGVPELDLQELMGFERVCGEQTDSCSTEESVAIAFNKRGEGPPGAA